MSTSITQLKNDLVERIGFQADWRDEKVQQFPGDDRNARSAEALRRLQQSLAALPENHPIWTRLWHVANRPRRLREQSTDDAGLAHSEAEQEFFRAYGFCGPEADDPAAFLERYIAELRGAEDSSAR